MTEQDAEYRIKVLNEYIWRMAHQTPGTKVDLHSILYDLSIIANGDPHAYFTARKDMGIEVSPLPQTTD